VKRNLLVFFSALVIFFSCKKIDVTNIGEGLIPSVDNVTTFDTVMDLITDNTLLLDSTRLLRSESHGLGLINSDPEFGKTKAEIYFSVSPASFGVHPFSRKDTNSYVFDSVVLALDYASLYGDSLSVEKFDVFEVSPDSYLKSKSDGYLIDTIDVPYETQLLGTKLVDFTTLNDSVYDKRKRDTLRLKNQLRIKLDNSLGLRFLAYDTSGAYKSDSAFYAAFRGLALRVDEGGSPAKNALAYFTLNATNTKLIFYYRVLSSTNAVADTVATEFGFYAFNSANVNLVKRTPAGNYQTYLGNGNGSDDKLYIQSSPGSVATIKIPNLNTLSNRIVHRAEIIFEDINPTETIYTKPNFLFMDAIDTVNKRIVTMPYDFNYENDFTNTFGGTVKNNKYIFNVSRYVQSIVTRKEKDYTLRLSAPFRTRAIDYASGLIPLTPIPINTPIAAGRVVLAGGNYSADPSKRARLRIIYSKI
jgi:hypothetical protein